MRTRLVHLVRCLLHLDAGQRPHTEVWRFNFQIRGKPSQLDERGLFVYVNNKQPEEAVFTAGSYDMQILSCAFGYLLYCFDFYLHVVRTVGWTKSPFTLFCHF